MAQSGRNAEYAAGRTVQSPSMQIDGGEQFKLDTSGTKQGRDKGGMNIDIKSAPSANSLANTAMKMSPTTASTSTMSPLKVDSGSNYGASRGSSFSNAMKGGMVSWGSGGGMMGLGRMD